MTKKTKQRIWYITVVLAVTVVVLVLLFWGFCRMGRMGLRKNIVADEPENGKNSSGEVLTYQGKTYQYRDDVINILCLGIDKEEIMSETDDDGGSVGQADAIVVLSIDTTAKKIRMLAVPRDTMTNLIQQDEEGKNSGFFQGQITLQYALGDGQEQSCLLTAERVSEILGKLPLNGYVAVNLSCIGTINDAVGGVTVTMDEDYTLFNSKFTKGSTVCLKGHEAVEFLQGRDIRVPKSAYMRMERQKQYVKAWIAQAKQAVCEDAFLPFALMQEMGENMLTDLGTARLLCLTRELSACDFSEEEMYILPGEIRMGAKYEEYYPDADKTTELLIKLFYEEI